MATPTLDGIALADSDDTILGSTVGRRVRCDGASPAAGALVLVAYRGDW